MNLPKPLPTQERLRELLRYEPETGDFYFIVKKGRLCPGDLAGCRNRRGYKTIGIDQVAFLAHRLAFLYMLGSAPPEIDHIDGNPSNNRWCNLREATCSQNHANTRRQSNNTSGYKGVSFDKRKRLWRADIKLNGRQYFVGYFRTPEEAHRAYLRKAVELHGEFARSE